MSDFISYTRDLRIGTGGCPRALLCRSHDYPLTFNIRKCEGPAVFEQKIFFCRKRHIAYRNLFVFIFIWLVHTQTEYDF